MLSEVSWCEQGIFWLQRPWLFRPVIKFLLFFISFVFTNSIYFSAIFGPHSCFFSRTGFQGPQFAPWWVRHPACQMPSRAIHTLHQGCVMGL